MSEVIIYRVTPKEKLEVAREVYKVAYTKFDKFTAYYRKREIGDAEFIFAQNAFRKAMAAMDAADEEYQSTRDS